MRYVNRKRGRQFRRDKKKQKKRKVVARKMSIESRDSPCTHVTVSRFNILKIRIVPSTTCFKTWGDKPYYTPLGGKSAKELTDFLYDEYECLDMASMYTLFNFDSWYLSDAKYVDHRPSVQETKYFDTYDLTKSELMIKERFEDNISHVNHNIKIKPNTRLRNRFLVRKEL